MGSYEDRNRTTAEWKLEYVMVVFIRKKVDMFLHFQIVSDSSLDWDAPHYTWNLDKSRRLHFSLLEVDLLDQRWILRDSQSCFFANKLDVI